MACNFFFVGYRAGKPRLDGSVDNFNICILINGKRGCCEVCNFEFIYFFVVCELDFMKR